MDEDLKSRLLAKRNLNPTEWDIDEKTLRIVRKGGPVDNPTPPEMQVEKPLMPSLQGRVDSEMQARTLQLGNGQSAVVGGAPTVRFAKSVNPSRQVDNALIAAGSSVIPTLAGLVGGAGATALAAPETGPGALAVGIPSGMAVAGGTEWLQNALLERFAPSVQKRVQDAVSENPKTAMLASAAVPLLVGRPTNPREIIRALGGSKVLANPTIQRLAINAAVGGGMDLGQQVYNKAGFDKPNLGLDQINLGEAAAQAGLNALVAGRQYDNRFNRATGLFGAADAAEAATVAAEKNLVTQGGERFKAPATEQVPLSTEEFVKKTPEFKKAQENLAKVNKKLEEKIVIEQAKEQAAKPLAELEQIQRQDELGIQRNPARATDFDKAVAEENARKLAEPAALGEKVQAQKEAALKEEQDNLLNIQRENIKLKQKRLIYENSKILEETQALQADPSQMTTLKPAESKFKITKEAPAKELPVVAPDQEDLRLRQIEDSFEEPSGRGRQRYASESTTPLEQRAKETGTDTALTKEQLQFWEPVAQKMGAKVRVEDGSIIGADGKPKFGESTARVAGQEALIRLSSNAGADTVPHELTHTFIDDMLKHGSKSDKKLASRVTTELEKTPEFVAWKAERDAKGLDADGNEFLSHTTGREAFRRLMLDKDNSSWSGAWKDFVSGAKVKWLRNANSSDYARFAANSIINGHPTPTGAFKLKGFGSDAGTTVPTKEEAVTEQVKLAKRSDSSRAAVLVTPGEKFTGDATGLVKVSTKFGDVLFNPAKTTREAVEAAAKGDNFDAKLLGMSQSAKPLSETVVTTSKDGVKDVQSEQVSPEGIPAAVEAAKKAVPGGEVEVKKVQDVLKHRVSKDDWMSGKEVPRNASESLNDEKFGVLDGPVRVRQMFNTEKPVSREQVMRTLEGKISPTELQIYKDAGIETKLGEKVTPSEVAKFMEENGPKVEVVDYGMEGKVSEAKREYDKMTHEWYENLPRDKQGEYINEADYIFGAGDVKQALMKKGWSEENATKGARYKDLSEVVRKEPRDTSPRATDYYHQVSALPTNEPMPEWTKTKSGKNVQRVDVVIPRKMGSVKDKMIGNYKAVTDAQVPTDKMLWQPDNLHENLPNTLGWAMIQYKTGPKGEKIAVIAEAQSRWGQELRENNAHKIKDADSLPDGYSWKEPTQSYIGYRLVDPNGNAVHSGQTKSEIIQKHNAQVASYITDHPLLRDYNRLILKAAIKQAREEGATHIVISDGETAMMTEQHDVFHPTIHTGRATDFVPDQAGGMRFNYDTVLPRIAEDLTGSKGERVSLGEHKNAFTYENRIGSGNDARTKVRDNLIFKNADGTPKTDVSGVMYPLSSVPETPFTMFGKRHASESLNSDSDSSAAPIPPTDPVKTSTYDYVKPISRVHAWTQPLLNKLAATGKPEAYIAQRLNEFTADRVGLHGELVTPVQRAISSLSDESANRVRNFMRLEQQGKKPSFTLNAKEKAVQDQIRSTLVKIAEMQKEQNMKVFEGGKARDREIDPSYFPDVIDPSVTRIMTQKQGTPEANKLRNDFIKHYMDNSKSKSDKSRAEAIKQLETAFTKGTSARTPEFAALTTPAGFGLPESWASKDLGHIMTTYAERAANALAYDRQVVTDPISRKLLRIPVDGQGEKTKYGEINALPDGTDISGVFLDQNDSVKAAMRHVTRDYSEKDVMYNVVSRAAKASIMQIPAGIRDVVSTPAIAAQMLKPSELPMLVKAWGSIKSGYEQGLKNGTIRLNTIGAQDAMFNDNKAFQVLDSYATGVNKLMGREYLERFSRAYVNSVGEMLYDSRLASGDKKSLEKFLPKDNVKRTPEQERSYAVARMVESVQGGYDIRGLPAAALEGPLQTILSLTKWSIERQNNFTKHVVEPARKGNLVPLLTSVVGGVLSGAAIQSLNKWISQSKPPEVTWEEYMNLKTDDAYFWMSMASYSSILGLQANLAKSAMDYKNTGRTRFGIGDPVLSLGGDVAGTVKDAIEAYQINGEMNFGMELTKSLASTLSENARAVLKYTEDQTEKGDKRDKKLFERLSDKPKQASTVLDTNPFAGVDEKKFEKEKDMTKAAAMVPGLVQGVAKDAKSYEDVKRGFTKLRTMPKQSMPDPFDDKEAFTEYIQFLNKIYTPDVVMEKVREAQKTKAINKDKQTLIPELK